MVFVSSAPRDQLSQPTGVGVRRMLTELAVPAGALRAEHRELEEQFVAALDPLLELFCSADSTASGETDFAVRQVIARAMSDTIASLHLITHGYLNQAYGTMRTAYEALDLVRLLAQDAEQAKLWVTTDQGYRDFSPGTVRKRLGEDAFDPVYSQLSEFSHPRFAASRLASFGLRKEDSQDLTVVVRVGPFLLDEAADHWLAASFMGPLIGTISVRLSQLAETGAVTEEAWEHAVLASQAAIVGMGKLIGGKLTGFGLDAADLLQQFDRAPEILAEINAEFPDE
jgi:hypothetical protein